MMKLMTLRRFNLHKFRVNYRNHLLLIATLRKSNLISLQSNLHNHCLTNQQHLLHRQKKPKYFEIDHTTPTKIQKNASNIDTIIDRIKARMKQNLDDLNLLVKENRQLKAANKKLEFLIKKNKTLEEEEELATALEADVNMD